MIIWVIAWWCLAVLLAWALCRITADIDDEEGTR